MSLNRNYQGFKPDWVPIHSHIPAFLKILRTLYSGVNGSSESLLTLSNPEM